VILADPEWTFDVWSTAGTNRSPDYPTSTLDVIASRDVASMAAPDAVLMLWVTAPHHVAGNGAAVMRAWGFEPKAEIIWDKVEVGTGFWFRNQHEILMIGVRGKVPAPAPGTQWPSIITSPKGAHSEKPDWQYDLAEDYFPGFKSIELNARRRHDGWDAWGFEAPDAVEPAQVREPIPDWTDSEVDHHVGDGQEMLADPLHGHIKIRQGEPADLAGGVLASSTGQRDAADPDEGAAAGAGEGGDATENAPDALPDPASLTSAQRDDIIRAGYAATPPRRITDLMVATGLSRDQIKKRAGKLKIAGRENQQRAVVASNQTRKRVAA
jgi:N6-adenosine-specific RNA methylase IME4